MSEGKVVVVTDSTAYIPAEAQEGLDIPVIPLWLIWGEERFRDGVDISPDEFYRRLETSKTLPTTSQPSAGEFVEFFKRVGADAAGIVGIFISSNLSGTVASALAAAKQLPEMDIRVIDSLETSMSLGLTVLPAARAAAAGKSVDEVAAIAEDARKRVKVLFVVDTLEYLYRGGRIGGAKRLLGTALNIKPLLHLDDGRVELLTQVRTKRKAIARLLNIIEDYLGGRALEEVSVLDVFAPKEGDALAEKVRARFGVSQVHRAKVSPVIGTHVGPGTVGAAIRAAG